MAARNEVAAAQNMPLMSPPKRTRLNIFGSSDTSALKAASWHAGTQFSLSDEVEEMHGRRAFEEDYGAGMSVAADSPGTAGAQVPSQVPASCASPLRRKVASRADSSIKVFDEQSAARFSDSGVFDMEMEECDSSSAAAQASAAAPQASAAAGATPFGPFAAGAGSQSPQLKAERVESRGPASEQGLQIEGAVFAMDDEVAASGKGTSPQPKPAADAGGMPMAEKEPPHYYEPARTVGGGGGGGGGGRSSCSVGATATSEAEASALAVLHAMAAGVLAQPRVAKANHHLRQQLPVLVKSDGSTGVVNDELLKKMGIPLKAPGIASAQALPFPIESPASKAATQVMGMSLNTPTAARVGADTPGGTQRGAGVNSICDRVLTAIGVLSPVAGGAEDTSVIGGSRVVAALADSIAGGECGIHEALGAEAGTDESRRAGEDELSTADEAAIAALQELGAAGGRWAKDRGGGFGAVDSTSGGSGAGGSSINSRHGAARGRQVTRSCPGCSQRISIACKFCTLCGYTFRRSTAQNQSQPSTPRDALLSPSRGVDVSVGALTAAASAGGGGVAAEGGPVDGAKSLGALLKKGKGAYQAAGAGELLSAAGVLLAPGDRSKMLTPVKSEAGASGADTPVKQESPDCAAAAITSGGVPGGEMAAEQSVSTPTARQTVTRVTANSLELHKIKEQARRAREKQLLARLQSLLFDGRESPPSASGVCLLFYKNLLLAHWRHTCASSPACLSGCA
jgi:hypothetical protein